MNNQVWIVDDNTVVGTSITALLHTEGIEAVCFASAASVLTQLQKGVVPAVLVTDLDMPDGDGNFLIREISMTPGWSFPVIVLTLCPELLDKESTTRVTQVLTKNIDPLVLVGHIRRALGQHVILQ